jgi:hypothetical protein
MGMVDTWHDGLWFLDSVSLLLAFLPHGFVHVFLHEEFWSSTSEAYQQTVHRDWAFIFHLQAPHDMT